MDADSGVLVEPRDDADQYADAVADLLGDEERRRAHRRAARASACCATSRCAEMASRHDASLRRPAALPPQPRRHARRARRSPAAARRADGPQRAAPLDRASRPERTVAVIVPCYQHGRFLPDCVASIRAQTLARDADHRRRRRLRRTPRPRPRWTSWSGRRRHGDPAGRQQRPERRAQPRARRGDARTTSCRSTPTTSCCPSALDDMVIQLEAAPDDVGFVYPNALHFGNRNDYVAGARVQPAPAARGQLLPGDVAVRPARVRRRRRL